MQPMLSYVKLALIGVILASTTAAATAQVKPGCQSQCGNISIPYPFGTTDGCYRDEHFLITCNTTFDPPVPFLSTSHIIDISLQGQLRVLNPVIYDCYNSSRPTTHIYNDNTSGPLHSNYFPLSNTKNKFTTVGCKIYGSVSSFEVRSGCQTSCEDSGDVLNGSRCGMGCCHTPITKGMRDYSIFVYNVNTTDSCGYGFVVEDGAFNFSSIDLYNLQNRTRFPIVLDWSIGNQTCNEAKKNPTSYACKENSSCIDSESGFGYVCNCRDGFQGNPYLANGCQDINECETLKPCNVTCHNVPGSYYCSCPIEYEGDGWKNGTGCSHKGHQAKRIPFIHIALGISISFVVLLLGIFCLYLGRKQRKLIKLREKWFQQNGGNLLQQQIARREGYGDETAKIFTAKELKRATNNYHESRILGQGGHGTVYRGILPDNRIVAIKKSKIGDQSQIEQFINEVIVLSQINHRNVVKLLGCCLETEVPLLVYEYVTNGTLFDHMHDPQRSSLIPWETRLKIATDTAGAFSYLHSAASTPIIHRDIKLTNILLDDNFNAKVSDFGASRLNPSDQSQLTTLVQGTLGYLDPEYFQTSKLTEKSDVFSFGVVLVELLTGKKAICFCRPEEERNFAMYFASAIRDNRLLEVLDHRVLSERNVEQLKVVAMLARRCLRPKGEERPTMKEVSMELEGLRAVEKHPCDRGGSNSEGADHLVSELRDVYGGGTTSGNAGDESIRSQVTFEIEGGR